MILLRYNICHDIAHFNTKIEQMAINSNQKMSVYGPNAQLDFIKGGFEPKGKIFCLKNASIG